MNDEGFHSEIHIFLNLLNGILDLQSKDNEESQCFILYTKETENLSHLKFCSFRPPHFSQLPYSLTPFGLTQAIGISQQHDSNSFAQF